MNIWYKKKIPHPSSIEIHQHLCNPLHSYDGPVADLGDINRWLGKGGSIRGKILTFIIEKYHVHEF
jgi:hypothetical protein